MAASKLFSRRIVHRSELENLWGAKAIFLATLGYGVGILSNLICLEGRTNYPIHSAGSNWFPLFYEKRAIRTGFMLDHSYLPQTASPVFILDGASLLDHQSEAMEDAHDDWSYVDPRDGGSLEL